MNHKELLCLIDNAVMKFWRRMRSEAPQLLPYISKDDLKSQAFLEVTKAMDSREPESEVPLEFYLLRCISNGLQDYCSKEVYQRKQLHNLDIRDLEIDEAAPEFPCPLLLDLESTLDSEESKMLEYLVAGYSLSEIQEGLKLSYRKTRELKERALTKAKECL